MKNQALFSLKDKGKKIKMSSAAMNVFGALRVNNHKSCRIFKTPLIIKMMVNNGENNLFPRDNLSPAEIAAKYNQNQRTFPNFP